VSCSRGRQWGPLSFGILARRDIASPSVERVDRCVRGAIPGGRCGRVAPTSSCRGTKSFEFGNTTPKRLLLLPAAGLVADNRTDAGHIAARVLEKHNREGDRDAPAILAERGDPQDVGAIASLPSAHDIAIVGPVPVTEAVRDDQVKRMYKKILVVVEGTSRMEHVVLAARRLARTRRARFICSWSAPKSGTWQPVAGPWRT
jgi:hypothetical protein